MPLQPIGTPPQTGKVDANGNVAISFPPVPQQLAWTATVAVTNATPDVNWVVLVAGVPVGNAQGSNPAGPFQIPPGGQLTLEAANLQPGATYQASISGSSIEQDLADPSPASAPPGSSAVTAINEQILIGRFTAPNSLLLNTPPSWSVLRVWPLGVAPTSGIDLTITGQQSTIEYAEALFCPATAMTPILLDPAADQQVNISSAAVGLGGPYYLTVQLNAPSMIFNSSEQPIYVVPTSTSPGRPGVPAEVYAVGGLLKANTLTVATGGGTAGALPTPPIGQMWRLHRWVFLPGAASPWSGNVILQGNTGSHWTYGTMNVAAQLIDNADGMLIGEACTFVNFSNVAGTFTIVYDQIATPAIA